MTKAASSELAASTLDLAAARRVAGPVVVAGTEPTLAAGADKMGG